jgi:hypothetical protein
VASKLLQDGEAWPDCDEGSVVGLKGGQKVAPGNPEEPPGRSFVEGKLDEEASSSVSSILASVVMLSGMSKYQNSSETSEACQLSYLQSSQERAEAI